MLHQGVTLEESHQLLRAQMLEALAVETLAAIPPAEMAHSNRAPVQPSVAIGRVATAYLGHHARCV